MPWPAGASSPPGADVRILASRPERRAQDPGSTRFSSGIGFPPSVLEPLRLAVPGIVALARRARGKLLPSPRRALRARPGRRGRRRRRAPRPRALARAVELARIPSAGFAQTKLALRRPALLAMQAGEDERERWLDTWFQRARAGRLQTARLPGLAVADFFIVKLGALSKAQRSHFCFSFRGRRVCLRAPPTPRSRPSSSSTSKATRRSRGTSPTTTR